MNVQVRNSEGELVWSRTAVGGMTSTSYAQDSTLRSILEMLEFAVRQCKGELSVADNVDRVCDGGAATP